MNSRLYHQFDCLTFSLHGDSVIQRSQGDAIGCCDRLRPPILSLPKRPVPIKVKTRREAGSN